jgi:hypothetical protein
MRKCQTCFALLLCIAGGVKLAIAVPQDSSAERKAPLESISEQIDERKVELPTIKEAGRQSRLLHETIHSTLQIVHLRNFRDDEGLPLPESTMKKVFR